MKIRNNKGFAISTLLYGLSIMGFLIVMLMISIMSSNRHNTSNFIKSIEEDLNRYSLTATTILPGTDANTAKMYTVPYGESGWYKIELWGSGGLKADGTDAGKGAYTSGLIYLEQEQNLYFYVGTQNKAGGTGNGGGSTDVRLYENGNAFSPDSINSRIMVAAGGGGGANGGDGGTIYGLKGDGTVGSAKQTKIGSSSIPFSSGNTDSGGGYYSGGANEGGSSFISGYAGVNAMQGSGSGYIESGQTNFVYAETIVHNDDGTIVYQNFNSNFVFINGQMVPGVNKGSGKAMIEKVSSNPKDQPPIPVRNTLNGVSSISDCIDSDSGEWLEIQAIDYTGENVAKSKASSSSNSTIIDGKIDGTPFNPTDTKCVTVNFSSPQNLREIAIWHKTDKTQVNGNTLKVNGIEIKKGGTSGEIETTTGNHYSAYQPPLTGNLPDGNYYISIKGNDSLVFTSFKDNRTFLVELNGSKNQKWRVEKIAEPSTYRLIETENYFAFQGADGTGEVGEWVNTPWAYRGNPEEQWIISSNNDGTYSVKSVRVSPNNSGVFVYGNGNELTLNGTGSSIKFTPIS